MASITLTIGNETFTVPEWAMESTQKEVLENVTELLKSSTKSERNVKTMSDDFKTFLDKYLSTVKDEKKDREKLEDAVEKTGKSLEDSADKIADSVDGLSNQLGRKEIFFTDVFNRLEADGEELIGALGRLGDTLVTVGLYTGGVFATAIAGVTNRLMMAGDTLNSLTKFGVGFNQSINGVSTSATKLIADFGTTGLGFRDSARLIEGFSNVVATAGMQNFRSSVRVASEAALEMGMSVEDAASEFGRALSRRQSLLDLGSVSQERLNTQVTRTVRQQTAYATALGQSTVEIANFVDSLITGNGVLSANLLRFSDSVRLQAVGGIEAFGTALRGLGGQAGGEIASAFVDAASAGVLGLSDAAVGYVSALPSLAGPMNDFIKSVNDGTISQENAGEFAQSLAKDLSNLSDTEKQRIFLLARTGDQSAAQLAEAITQFEQSERKIAEINKALATGFDMDSVQKGTNAFNKLLGQASGGISNAFFSLFADESLMAALEDGFKEIFAALGFGLNDVEDGISSAGSSIGNLAKDLIPVVKGMANTAAAAIKSFKEYMSEFTVDGELDFSAMINDILDKAVDGIVSALVKGIALFIPAIFAYSMAKQAASDFLLPAAKNFMQGIFQRGTASKVTEFVVGGFQSLMSGVSGTGATGVMGTIQKGFDWMKGLPEKFSTVAQGAAKAAGGAGGAAGGIMDKISSASSKIPDIDMPGGKAAKGPSFIDKILETFGKNTAVKAAGTMALVSGSMLMLAKALKDFADVEFEGIIKGGIAMAGLIKAMEFIKPADTIKASTSLLILGSSLIPLSYALGEFADVSFADVGVGLTALAGLIALSKGVSKAGSQLISGSIGIAALGASLIPLAFSLNLMKDVGIGTLGALFGALVIAGAGAVAFAALSPAILAGAGAIAVLGAALIPFAAGIALLGSGMENVAEGMAAFSNIDYDNISGLGGSLLSLAPGLAVIATLAPVIALASAASGPLKELASSLTMFNDVDAENATKAGLALTAVGEGLSNIIGSNISAGFKETVAGLFGVDSVGERLQSVAESLKGVDLTGIYAISDSVNSLELAEDVLLRVSSGMQAMASSMNTVTQSVSAFREAVSEIGVIDTMKIGLLAATGATKQSAAPQAVSMFKDQSMPEIISGTAPAEKRSPQAAVEIADPLESDGATGGIITEIPAGLPKVQKTSTNMTPRERAAEFRKRRERERQDVLKQSRAERSVVRPKEQTPSRVTEIESPAAIAARNQESAAAQQPQQMEPARSAVTQTPIQNESENILRELVNLQRQNNDLSKRLIQAISNLE